MKSELECDSFRRTSIPQGLQVLSFGLKYKFFLILLSSLVDEFCPVAARDQNV